MSRYQNFNRISSQNYQVIQTGVEKTVQWAISIEYGAPWIVVITGMFEKAPMLNYAGGY